MGERFADAELAEWVAGQPSFAAAGAPDPLALRGAAAERSARRPREPAVDRVEDLSGPGPPLRLYVPAGAGSAPLLVWLHGGGWTIGSLDSHDRLCRWFAAGAGIRVLAVDYRLAPEHPWPAAIDDAVSVLRLVAGEASSAPAAGASSAPAAGASSAPAAGASSAPAAGAPSARAVESTSPRGGVGARVAVGGDSAGGTLAALACLRLRDEAPEAMPGVQVLACANTDLTGASPSMTEKARGFGLDAEMVHFFNRQWVPDAADWSRPDVSPLHAPDLTGLPPALVITAEHDPLRDEAEAYARRLTDAGVRVTARREPGLVHNFMMLADLSPACRRATDRLVADVGSLLTAPG